jgi:hypothetical protein
VLWHHGLGLLVHAFLFCLLRFPHPTPPPSSPLAPACPAISPVLCSCGRTTALRC